jgi:SAM-dependent methyltransferase
VSDAQDAEFDTVAAWTAEAVLELGQEYAEPAACRGTGGRTALRWLADRLPLPPGSLLLDVGAGLGGPAAVARRVLDLRPVVVDVEQQACVGARRLFDLPAVRADAHRLPFPDRLAPGLWCLGTVCTSDQQGRLVAELVRVVEPGAPMGLMVLVATGSATVHAATGNTFPTVPGLRRLLEGAGAVVDEQAWADDPGDDEDWDGRAEQVDDLVRRRHGDSSAYRQARDQEEALGKLLADGVIRRRLVAARRAR